jgi:hypothetical protein
MPESSVVGSLGMAAVRVPPDTGAPPVGDVPRAAEEPVALAAPDAEPLLQALTVSATAAETARAPKQRRRYRCGTGELLIRGSRGSHDGG